MKRILPGVAGAAALGVFVITFWGMYLPESVETSTRVTMPASVNTVWAVMSEPEGRARWWGSVERIEPDGISDPTRLGWTEYYEDGSSRTFNRTNFFPPRAQTYVSSRKCGAVDEWTIQVLPGDDGTRVVLTRNRFVSNPVFRFFYHYFSDAGQIGEQMLAALSEQVQK